MLLIFALKVSLNLCGQATVYKDPKILGLYLYRFISLASFFEYLLSIQLFNNPYFCYKGILTLLLSLTLPHWECHFSPGHREM